MGINAIPKKEIRRYLKNISTEERSSLQILQIGANDGIQNDPIRELITRFNLKADLLEPIPYYYEELKKNYSQYPRVKCHNLAISNNTGEKQMHWLKYDDSLATWMKGLNTFDISQNFLGTGKTGYQMKEDSSRSKEYEYVKNNLETIFVKTTTLKTFLEDNHITRIDIYVSDTEGHDGLIFEQLDLNFYNPKIILMETHGLGEEENLKIDNKLKKYNYEILAKNLDTFAIKN